MRAIKTITDELLLALKGEHVIKAIEALVERRVATVTASLDLENATLKNDFATLRVQHDALARELIKYRADTSTTVTWPTKTEKGGNPVLAAVHTELANKERRKTHLCRQMVSDRLPQR